MEKTIKGLSLFTIVIIGVFFITIVGAASLGMNNNNGTIYKVLGTGANFTLYVVPVSFLITFVIGMFCLFKRLMNSQNRMAGKKKPEKFPTLFFVISVVLFILYMVFVIAVMLTGE